MLEEEAADLGLDAGSYDPPLELVGAGHRRGSGLRDRGRRRRRRVDPARGRGDLVERHPGAGGQPRARRVPGRGRVRRRRGDDRSDRPAHLDPRGPPHARRPRLPRRRAGDPHVRAQRGQRREGRPRADDRGRRRDRRPPAVPVGLRRGRALDADGIHRLQLQRRRPGGLARRRGAAGRADQRARAVRPPDGGRAGLRGRRRGHRPHRRRRGAVVRRPPARGPAARAPGSRYAAASARSAWPGCTGRRSPTAWSPSSTCRSRAGAAPPSADAGPRTPRGRRTAGA